MLQADIHRTAGSAAALDPEDAFILSCARGFLGTGDRPSAARDLRWRVVTERLRWHGLHGTLYPFLSRELGAVIPSEAMVELGVGARLQAARNLKLAEAMREVTRAFREAELEYVILKGLPLAQAAYGTIAGRRARDLDLLVRPENFEDARGVLADLGFTPTWNLDAASERCVLRFTGDIPLARGDGTLIELHRGFSFNPPKVAAACARLLLRDARPVAACGMEVPAVVGPAALPYLCLHGSHHAWFRLFWLLDVATITLRAREENVAAAWTAARRLGADRHLALGWCLASELFGVTVPTIARPATEGRRIGRLAHLARTNALGDAQPTHTGSLARRVAGLSWALRLVRGPLGMLGIVGRYIVSVQPEEIRATRLPPALKWTYPAIRPIRLLARLVTKGGRQLFGG